jgi:hypothetical protein
MKRKLKMPVWGSGLVSSRSLTSFEMTDRFLCCHSEPSEESFSAWGFGALKLNHYPGCTALTP